MRSAVLTGLALLAGCKQPEQAPAPASDDKPVVTATTTDQPATETAMPAPIQPSEAPKAQIATLPVSPVKATHYQALGTEPFWSLEVLPGKLIYTSPEVQPGIAVTYTFTSQGRQMRYSGTLEGKPLLLTIEPGTCSDGMSDTVYPYKSSFTWGERTERGCARLK